MGFLSLAALALAVALVAVGGSGRVRALDDNNDSLAETRARVNSVVRLGPPPGQQNQVSASRRVWQAVAPVDVLVDVEGNATLHFYAVYGGVGIGADQNNPLPLSTVYDDLWIYLPPSSKIAFPFWYQYHAPDTRPGVSVPGARGGHTMTAVRRGSFVLLGGATWSSFPAGETLWHMTPWLFDASRLDGMEIAVLFTLQNGGGPTKIPGKVPRFWQPLGLTAGSAVPSPRIWHTAQEYPLAGGERAIVVFGGASGPQRGRAACVQTCLPTNDTAWLLTLGQLGDGPATWTAITAGGGPSPRYWHSAVVYQGGMYVTGGLSPPSNSNQKLPFERDMFVLRGSTLATMAWTNLGLASVSGSAASALGPDGGWYLYGGLRSKSHEHSDNFYTTTGDVQRIDLATLKPGENVVPLSNYSHLEICRPMVTGVLGASAVSTHDGSVLLVGGAETIDGQLQLTNIVVQEHDLGANMWTSFPNSAAPKPTINAAAAALNPGGIFVFGGRSPLFQATADLWELKISTAGSQSVIGPRQQSVVWRIFPGPSFISDVIAVPPAREGHTFSPIIDSTLQPVGVGVVFAGHVAGQSASSECGTPRHASCECTYVAPTPEAPFFVSFYADTWTYDSSALAWQRGSPGADGPPCRTHHAADIASFGGESFMLVHGGFTASALSGGASYTSDTHVPRWATQTGNQTGIYILGDLWKGLIHPTTRSVTWRRLRPAGPRPTERAVHAGAAMRRKFVIFGGLARDDTGQLAVSSETWMLDLEALTWYHVVRSEPGFPVGPRFGHSLERMGGRNSLLYGGLGDVYGASFPEQAYLFFGDEGDDASWLWTLWGNNTGVPGTALAASASLLGNGRQNLLGQYSRFYSLWGLQSGSYVYLKSDSSQFVTTCTAGYGFESSCVSAEFAERGYAIDCQCRKCERGTYATIQFLTCQPCPGQLSTPGEGSPSSASCTACKPNACSRHGDCTIINPKAGTISCRCSLGNYGADCSQSWGYPLLGIAVVLVILAGVLAARKWRGQQKVYKTLVYTTELQENLLTETQLENEQLRHAWDISHESLRLQRRIDLNSEGSTGQVWLATWQTYQVAVKYLRKSLIEMDGSSAEVFREEVDFMRTIRHDHIVLFLGAGIEEEDHIPFLVTEFMQRGSLFELLADKTQELPWPLRSRFALDCALGLEYLHGLSPSRLHRDVKSGNVLIAQDYTAKLADFGTSRLISGIQEADTTQREAFSESASLSSAYLTKAIGTPCWMAPEVMEGESYGAGADVYSFAIVMWEILTQQRPFHDFSWEWEVREGVLSGARPTVPPEARAAHEEFARLMEACWHADQAGRPGIASVARQLRLILSDRDPRRHTLGARDLY